MEHGLWARAGAELLDKIGPSIMLVHSAGGPFSWLAANERPNLVKAIVNVEGFGSAFDRGALKNLQGIPVAIVSADRSGRTQGPASVAFLKQAGCDAEELALRDKGVLGNGHMMIIEENRRQVFDAINGWIEHKLPA